MPVLVGMSWVGVGDPGGSAQIVGPQRGEAKTGVSWGGGKGSIRTLLDSALPRGQAVSPVS